MPTASFLNKKMKRAVEMCSVQSVHDVPRRDADGAHHDDDCDERAEHKLPLAVQEGELFDDLLRRGVVQLDDFLGYYHIDGRILLTVHIGDT